MGGYFEADRFVEQCRAALDDPNPLTALHAAMSDVLENRVALLSALPVGRGLRVSVLHEGPHLTVVQFVTPGGFTFPPHDHAMVSAVGVYSGVEENVYYALCDDGLCETERRRVGTGQVAVHDRDVIHAIASGGDEPLGALHVYGGAFFDTPRSEWRGSPLTQVPYDTARLRALAASGK